MYCSHCGKEINIDKVESKFNSAEIVEAEQTESLEETKVAYVCPRCGHLVHDHLDEADIKSLSAASHAEIQRGRNFFSNGMCLNVIAIIILILAALFLALAHKPANNHQLVMTSPEFYVSVIAFAVGGVMLIVGIVFTILGLLKKTRYSRLLKDIQNEVFFQQLLTCMIVKKEDKS